MSDQDQNKLIATHTDQRIAGADTTASHLCNSCQQIITRLSSKPLIKCSEVIDVEIETGDGSILAEPLRQWLMAVWLQETAVVGAGK